MFRLEIISDADNKVTLCVIMDLSAKIIITPPKMILHSKCLPHNFKKDVKKKGQILYIVGRDDQIATSAKLFDIIQFYGFNSDLLMTNEYQCCKGGFC